MAGRWTIVPKRASGDIGLPPHPPTKFRRPGTGRLGETSEARLKIRTQSLPPFLAVEMRGGVQVAISPTLPSCKSLHNRAKVSRLTPPAFPLRKQVTPTYSPDSLLAGFQALECWGLLLTSMSSCPLLLTWFPHLEGGMSCLQEPLQRIGALYKMYKHPAWVRQLCR